MQLINGIPNEKLLIFTEAFGSFLRATNQTHIAHGEPVNFAELKTNEQTLTDAESSARLYAEARNRNTQPKSLAGLDQSLVASVKAWANARNSHFRGIKRQKNSTD